MRSTQTDAPDRLRTNVADLAVLGAATALAFFAVLELGLLGLVVGCLAMSVAAAVVIRRQVDSRDPATEPTTDDRVVTTDGGRFED